jgi:hypothetical protein
MAIPPRSYGKGPYGTGPYSRYPPVGAISVGGAATLSFATRLSRPVLITAVYQRARLVFGVSAASIGINRPIWADATLLFSGSLALTYAWPRSGPCETGAWTPLGPSSGTWAPLDACSTGTWTKAA